METKVIEACRCALETLDHIGCAIIAPDLCGTSKISEKWISENGGSIAVWAKAVDLLRVALGENNGTQQRDCVSNFQS